MSSTPLTFPPQEMHQSIDALCELKERYIDSSQFQYEVDIQDRVRALLLARNLGITSPCWEPPVRVTTDGVTSGRGVVTTHNVSCGAILTRFPVDVLGIPSDRRQKNSRGRTYTSCAPPRPGRTPESRTDPARVSEHPESVVLVSRSPLPDYEEFPMLLFSDTRHFSPDECAHMINDACYYPEHMRQYVSLSAIGANALVIFPLTACAYVIAAKDIPEGEEVLISYGVDGWERQFKTLGDDDGAD